MLREGLESGPDWKVSWIGKCVRLESGSDWKVGWVSAGGRGKWERYFCVNEFQFSFSLVNAQGSYRLPYLPLIGQIVFQDCSSEITRGSGRFVVSYVTVESRFNVRSKCKLAYPADSSGGFKKYHLTQIGGFSSSRSPNWLQEAGCARINNRGISLLLCWKFCWHFSTSYILVTVSDLFKCRSEYGHKYS